jgi:hypothetical protein
MERRRDDRLVLDPGEEIGRLARHIIELDQNIPCRGTCANASHTGHGAKRALHIRGLATRPPGSVHPHTTDAPAHHAWRV